MRITLISLWSSGGMLHYIARLSSALACQSRLTISVVLPADADTYLFSDRVRLCPVKLPNELSLSHVLQVLTGVSFVSLYRTITSTRPSVIHFSSSHPLLIAMAPMLARKYHIVATVHDAISHPGVDEGIRKSLERRAILRHSERIFVHREVIRDQLLDSFDFVDSQKVLISPHGDYDFFADFEGSTTREPATLLFFGRISVYKGLTYLVQAVNIVRDRIPNLRVVVAGSGTFEDDVAAALTSSIYEVHNRFIGDEEVSSFFRRATAVVLPYIEASESGVIRIAEAFNRPVISTRVGGIPEAVRDGETGLIVAPADVEGLANAIQEMLLDPEMRVRFESAMVAANESRPSWREAAEIICTCYFELVGRNDGD